METVRIREGKKSDPGSGINIPDPQHWLELKSKSLDKLLDSEVPDLFKIGKPDLPVVLMSTALSDLVGPQSWLLLKLADVPQRGCVEVGKRRSQLVLWHFQALCRCQ